MKALIVVTGNKHGSVYKIDKTSDSKRRVF